MSTRGQAMHLIVGVLWAGAFWPPSANAQTILYVDDDASGANNGASWSDTYRYLQDALAAAAASGGRITEIRVAEGVYQPDQGARQTRGDREATFQLLNGVALEGGYAGDKAPEPDKRRIGDYETVLTGDLRANDETGRLGKGRDDNSFHVVTGSHTDETAVLDGFTVTGGYADVSAQKNGGGGGGMHNVSGSPTVRGCTFADNVADVYGGGMLNVSHSNPNLVNCTFMGNYGLPFAGGVGNIYSDPVLVNCVFRGNHGGGMYNEHSKPALVNCVFVANHSRVGGGAMFNVHSSPTLANCTVYDNHSEGGTGGIYDGDGSKSTLTNCIIWANYVQHGRRRFRTTDYSAQIKRLGVGPIIKHCCIQGWDGEGHGTGTFGSDPLFVDADGPDDKPGTPDDDLRLSPASPCIDAGDNSAVTVSTDFAGKPRITKGRDRPVVDIGAYEFQPTVE